MGQPDSEAVRQWLVASCAAQGVPVQVTNAVLVAKLGVLLGRVAKGFGDVDAQVWGHVA